MSPRLQLFCCDCIVDLGTALNAAITGYLGPRVEYEAALHAAMDMLSESTITADAPRTIPTRDRPEVLAQVKYYAEVAGLPYEKLSPLNQFLVAIPPYVFYCLENHLPPDPDLREEAKRLMAQAGFPRYLQEELGYPISQTIKGAFWRPIPPAGGRENGSWFRRHLNWTYVLAYPVGYGIGRLVPIGLESIGLPPNESVSAVLGWSGVLGVVIVTGWVLRQKGRRLWWLLTLLVPLLGQVVPLALHNKTRSPRPGSAPSPQEPVEASDPTNRRPPLPNSSDRVAFLLLKSTNDVVVSVRAQLEADMGLHGSQLSKVETELTLFSWFALDYWISQLVNQSERHTIMEALSSHWRGVLGNDAEGQVMLRTLEDRLSTYGQAVNEQGSDSAKMFRLGRTLSELCGFPGNTHLLTMGPHLFTRTLEVVNDALPTRG